MKEYSEYIKKNGATDLNVYLALCIVEEYRKAKKNGLFLSVLVEAEKGQIKGVNYSRVKTST